MASKRSTTSDNSNRKQVIRLSDGDRQFVLAGLNWMVGIYKLLNEGRRPIPASLERVRASRFDPGVFQQELMDSILGLWANLSSLGAGGRLRVTTSFEIAACALAVRVAVKRHQHGHAQLNIQRIDTASKRLLRRLEVVRKRLKRNEIRRTGLEGHQRKAQEWKSFVKWLHVHIPNCNCPGRKRSMPRYSRRAIVDKLVTWTREELVDRKAEIPDDHELRRLVRLALRYVRRGRTGYSVGDLQHDKAFAAIRLATFVTTHLEKHANWRTYEQHDKLQYNHW